MYSTCGLHLCLNYESLELQVILKKSKFLQIANFLVVAEFGPRFIEYVHSEGLNLANGKKSQNLP